MDDALNSKAWLQPNTFMDIISPKAKNSSPRSQPHKSTTLMRSAVKKPNLAARAIEEANSAYSSSINTSRPNLAEAASLTQKSPLISRFTPSSQQYAAVEEQPASFTETLDTDTNNESSLFNSQSMDAEPIAMALEQPSINIFKAQPSNYDFDQPVKKVGRWDTIKRFSGWSVLAVAVVGIVGGGIFINSNLSKAELYLASSKAGFAATLPSVKPSGFDLTGIATGGGAIEASYKSNIDNRTYSISEKKSSVSNSELMNNYVQSKAGLNFQTVNTDGNTIYIYDGHDATWTNKGIWYILSDNNSLSDHQIINIADSM